MNYSNKKHQTASSSLSHHLNPTRPIMDDLSRPRPRQPKPSSSSRQCRRSWCCSFTVPPSSPDSKPSSAKKLDAAAAATKSSLALVNRIDRRRILSPGRVSPIDSCPIPIPPHSPPPPADVISEMSDVRFGRSDVSEAVFDVRLSLRGGGGQGLVVELSSEVLSLNSELFAGLINEYRKSSCSREGAGSKVCRIEVPDVENVGVFREAIELMFEEGEGEVIKRLMRIGVFRVIDVLQVSAGIMFTKGVLSCLKYLEAVPWTEEEEEKLRNLLTRFKFDEATTRDILARLDVLESVDSQQNLSRQLVSSITTCTDFNARHELKLLVKGLLCRSSVYEKDHHDLNKEDIYDVCRSCLSSLVSLFEEATDRNSHQKTGKEAGKPMIERVSRQVDNINWLLDILLDRQMAEDFVDIWAEQGELLKMHADASPMVRYELSRVSAILFVAMGTRKLQCQSDSRSGLLQAWFGPMLLDFGWLQRCRKGLDIKSLEEALGQTLLTLPLTQQYTHFMEWFRYFSKHSTESPNLSKAFQIWWRRSFLRGSETSAIESR